MFQYATSLFLGKQSGGLAPARGFPWKTMCTRFQSGLFWSQGPFYIWIELSQRGADSFYFTPKWPLYSSLVSFSVLCSVVSSLCLCRHMSKLGEKQAEHEETIGTHTHTHICRHSCGITCRLLSSLPCLTHFGCFWNTRRAFPACQVKTPLCCRRKVDWGPSPMSLFTTIIHDISAITRQKSKLLCQHTPRINIQGAGNHSSQII